MTEPSELSKKGHAFANEKLFEERMEAIVEGLRVCWDIARWEIGKLVDSPIERAMGEALVSCPDLCYRDAPYIRAPGGTWLAVDYAQIAPQHRIGNFRADFAIVQRAVDGWRCVVVECDGHNFHEKTKEQAAHDKARDRFFVAQGWTVLRFTGSEIYRDAGACADQVGSLLMGLNPIAAREHPPA